MKYKGYKVDIKENKIKVEYKEYVIDILKIRKTELWGLIYNKKDKSIPICIESIDTVDINKLFKKCTDTIDRF